MSEQRFYIAPGKNLAALPFPQKNDLSPLLIRQREKVAVV